MAGEGGAACSTATDLQHRCRSAAPLQRPRGRGRPEVTSLGASQPRRGNQPPTLQPRTPLAPRSVAFPGAECPRTRRRPRGGCCRPRPPATSAPCTAWEPCTRCPPRAVGRSAVLLCGFRRRVPRAMPDLLSACLPAHLPASLSGLSPLVMPHSITFTTFACSHLPGWRGLGTGLQRGDAPLPRSSRAWTPRQFPHPCAKPSQWQGPEVTRSPTAKTLWYQWPSMTRPAILPHARRRGDAKRIVMGGGA